MKKTAVGKWMLVAVLLPLLAVALSGCAGIREQRALQRGTATARRELGKKYNLVSIDVRMSERAGRQVSGVFVTYNTKMDLKSPERWLETRDVLRICMESFNGEFGFIQLETRQLDRSGRRVLLSTTIVANPYEIATMLKTPYNPAKAESAWPGGK
jgi:hypothetical protein